MVSSWADWYQTSALIMQVVFLRVRKLPTSNTVVDYIIVVAVTLKILHSTIVTSGTTFVNVPQDPNHTKLNCFIHTLSLS